MASKTDIFNMALMELGIASPVTNATINTDNKAIILNNFYDNAKDEVLKAFDWNFAEKFKELSLAENYESLDPNFIYCFDYPSDCLNARDVYEIGNKLRRKFKLSANEQGARVILTNVNPCVLRYTRKITTEIYFTSEFSSALALYLASLAGMALTGSEQKTNNALKKYYERIRLSRVVNASEGDEVDEDDKTYVDCRE